jgi:RNA polymerase sigma-70 factor (sigma-E family)
MKTGQDFEEFVRARSTMLLRVAYALVGDHGHAEDILQTALLRTARRWPAARDAPEAYTRQVLLNLTRDRVRWLRRRPRETALADRTGPPDRADVLADRIGDQRTLVQALGGLPAGQRQVIVLRFLEDLSVAETAELLGISQGTVKSYTSRALARLRRVLAEPPVIGNCDVTEVSHAH